MNEPGSNMAEQAGLREEVVRLARVAQAGDRAAFEALYRLHVERVHARLWVLLGSSADADDATQTTFVEAYRNLHKFDFSSQFATWLHGIALRVALNAKRSRRRRGLAMARAAAEHPSPTMPTPENLAGSREEVALFCRYLDAVDDDKRVPFVLHYFERMDLDEVAELAGVHREVVWKRIKRAREQVVRAMEQDAKRDQRRGRGRT